MNVHLIIPLSNLLLIPLIALSIENFPLARMMNWGMHVARCDNTRPEDRHHVHSRILVLLDELGAEPEALDKHPHHDESSQRGRDDTHCAKLPRSPMRSRTRARMLVRGCVECLDDGDGRDGVVYDDRDDSRLLALGCKEGEQRGLERCLG